MKNRHGQKHVEIFSCSGRAGGRVDLALHGDGKRNKYFVLVKLWLNRVCKPIKRGVAKCTRVPSHDLDQQGCTYMLAALRMRSFCMLSESIFQTSPPSIRPFLAGTFARYTFSAANTISSLFLIVSVAYCRLVPCWATAAMHSARSPFISWLANSRACRPAAARGVGGV